MYEEYTQALPDLDGFLARIDMADVKREIILDYLNRIIDQFQKNIPFENLDIYPEQKELSLTIPNLYDKLVTRRRGGFCFEMNGLLTQALIDLGFSAVSVFCRIMIGRDYIPECTHRGILVNLDGQLHYCDVGFGGPQPGAAVPVCDGSTTETPTGTFRVHAYNTHWWKLTKCLPDGQELEVLHFCDLPQQPAEFIPVTYYCSHSARVVFTRQYMANIRTATGSKNLTADTFSILNHTKSPEKTELPIADDAHRAALLKEHFGIVL